ncbi:Glutamate-rich WD repeat-containing protein 1 [Galdieria sulphuraria]|uniref:Transducin family protein / WD-40 repeat family protein n=1 Tax=Galdieria sulphuraria TaxID=130081 RepID=M2Y1G4_GALSU|nr:transducin family protein / WD-40 repeat family protein [Galdieria sulphuraria]EME29763.1 transducin family protein / WD-40 repeat family protein [Galdieria sulphuraria]GJD06748.1 Glutamate-rich WD repeat-containing protein 1 [Galdieria sulphuraria]|eukprot:XP_005706283.1 transducin family protein / WD-40 repeat family protein [Galdieria sulphuraria]
MGKRKQAKSPAKAKSLVEETAEENLTYDPSTYDFFFELDSEWPCLTFDFLSGESNAQTTQPFSVGFLSGTQADKPHKNQILFAKISNIFKRRPKTESESDESDDEDEQEPHFYSYTHKHRGTVNRIRVAPQQEASLAALWSDTGVFEFIQYGSLSALESSDRKGDLIQLLQNYEDPMGEGFSISWSPLSFGHLVCGNCVGNIRWWLPSSETGSSFVVNTQPFEGHQNSVEDLQWSPVEPTVFVSSSVDQSIRFWDTRLGKHCALVMERAHASDINVLSWNPIDTHLLVSGGDEGIFQVWDLRTLSTEQGSQNPTSPVAKFDFHKSPIVAIEWSPFESSSLVCAAADGRISFWDLSLEADQDEESEQAMNLDEKWKDVPPQLLFLHEGQKDPKDVHWHPQIPSFTMSTGFNGFHIFKPENI